MAENPYAPPAATASPALPRGAAGNRGDGCPICETAVSGWRKWRLAYRCPRCGVKLGTRPLLRYTLPAIVGVVIAHYWLWRGLQGDLARIVDLGRWLMVVPSLGLVPILVGQALGRPAVLRGWRWAPRDSVAAMRVAWWENAAAGQVDPAAGQSSDRHAGG